MLRVSSIAVLFVMVAWNAAAQELPKPGPEHERLAKEMVGEWDCQIEMQGHQSKGKATYKVICDGMWLSSEFSGELAGAKFNGHGLDGYDLQKKKYVGVWVDTWTSGPLTMEGDYDPKTKKLTMTGEALGHTGQLEKFKNVTQTKDEDHFTFTMFMVGADGKEEPALKIEYTRRK